MTEAKKCSVANCKRPHRAKGYCALHFKKWRAGGMEGHKRRYKICKEENCRKPLFKKGMCEQHFGAWAASKKGVTPETAAAPAAAPAEGAAPATSAA
ncbi:MAG: hypothetical protein COV46_08715 [Deltaproteobacteria bacterium CG11_big_fil_rev_8_21_14_0_20_49_13]|nr:MAG: hypothetical protein COV46_08715 [Deltaproteobacteria bacterium CG11_big_fil_rev_8_21_14_0_20_49_13]